MSQEERELLLQDLCVRLPYGVQGISSEGKVSPLLTRGEADWDILTSLNYRIIKHGWKPYLRPMSSMTEYEDKEFALIQTDFYVDGFLYPFAATNMVDWLNAHHFDYRGLIEKGLALAAPEGMYNTKN